MQDRIQETGYRKTLESFLTFHVGNTVVSGGKERKQKVTSHNFTVKFFYIIQYFASNYNIINSGKPFVLYCLINFIFLVKKQFSLKYVFIIFAFNLIITYKAKPIFFVLVLLLVNDNHLFKDSDLRCLIFLFCNFAETSSWKYFFM